jgi:hypothetical protein
MCYVGQTYHKDMLWGRRIQYWDMTSQIFGQNISFLVNCKVILVYIGRQSYQQLQDDNIIYWKMKNNLTTGSWQDNI